MPRKFFSALALAALMAGLIPAFGYAQAEPQNANKNSVSADGNAFEVDNATPVPYPGNPAIWRGVRSAWEHLRQIPTDSLDRDAFIQERHLVYTELERLKSTKTSKPETDYIILEFRKELNRISSTYKIESDRECVRTAWDDLKATTDSLKNINAAARLNTFVLRLVCDDIRNLIATLAKFPIDRRLKHLEIKVGEYKKTLGALMDEFGRYYKLFEDHENLYLSTNPAPGAPAEPRKTPAGDKDTKAYEHGREFFLVMIAVKYYGGLRVSKVNGDVLVRRPALTGETSADKQWVALTAGAELDAFDLLEISAAKTAGLVLEDGRVAELAPGAVMTLWEVDFKLSQEKTDEINKLIEELGTEDPQTRREAERKLTAMGCLALPVMRAALVGADMERACRLRRIIHAVSAKYLS